MLLEKKTVGQDDLAFLKAIDDKNIMLNMKERFFKDIIYVILTKAL